jgi:hypothetical protein
MKSVTESIDIKTLISVGDLVADAPHLKQEQKKEDGTLKKSDLLGARALDGATAGRGLLGVYLIDPQSKPTFKESLNDRVPLNLETPLVALYFVFPETKNVSAADFYIPNLLDKAELEAADSDLEDYLDGKNPGAEVQNG